MRGRRTFIAAMSVLMSVGVVGFAAAAPVSNYDSSVLSFMCRVQGGVYAPPSAECNGCFYCLFPDGTLINCDGGGTCSTTKEVKLDSYNLLGAITKNQLALKEPANPDLVPLPPPASTPTPEGFCRRNDQGQLLLKVYNQGGAAAVASKTRIVFGSATPVDFDTPSIAAGTGTDLVIDIPTSCFDANTLRCSFIIGVDANSVVVEANETNNNAAGECGPQFQ